VTPDFDVLLLSNVGLAVPVLAFLGWRFGAWRAAAFVVIAGLFPATMDFLSSFADRNYEYPGQSRVWVFTYIFFGWISVCGTCLLIAEGVLARPGETVLDAPRLRWQAPLLAGATAILLDLFIDPVAVAAGYWVWLLPANVYYGIPLLNFVGWFVLMLLAPLAWIEVVRRPTWGPAKMMAAAALAVPLLGAASVALAGALNRMIALAGLQ
jgi:putative membrane protein